MHFSVRSWFSFRPSEIEVPWFLHSTNDESQRRPDHTSVSVITIGVHYAPFIFHHKGQHNRHSSFDAVPHFSHVCTGASIKLSRHPEADSMQWSVRSKTDKQPAISFPSHLPLLSRVVHGPSHWICPPRTPLGSSRKRKPRETGTTPARNIHRIYCRNRNPCCNYFW